MAAAQPGVLRTAHASGLNAVGRELAELHRAMLRSAGDETRGVRLSVLTLVAACVDDAGADQAGAVVAEIAGHHPARAIIVVARPDDGGGITADLSLQCSTARGSEQVCAEMVRLRVGGEPALHLLSVIVPLLLPDVPVVLWVVGAAPLRQALQPETLELCDQLIVDSAAHGDAAATLSGIAATLERRSSTAVSDLAWTRTMPWREQLARAFDRADLRPFVSRVSQAVIESPGSAGAGAEALLAAGWLRSRLGERLETLTLRSRANDGDGGGGGGGLESIRLECRQGERRASVVVRRDGGAVVAEADVDRTRVILPGAADRRDDTAALVGSVLEAQGPDPLYAAALRAQPWREAAAP
jgi:glucose-6-phosphate dehydrogenase assembly protein OpcA